MAEIEDRWRDLGEFIREQRRIGQLSLRKLSEMAGISNPYLSQIERGLRKPSAEILRQIAGALQISAETLYVRAGILDERDGGHDLVAEIHRDPFLDEDQKRTLVHIYLSFRDAYVAERLAQGLPLPEDGAADEASEADDVVPGHEGAATPPTGATEDGPDTGDAPHGPSRHAPVEPGSDVEDLPAAADDEHPPAA